MGHSQPNETNIALRVDTQRAFYIVTIVSFPLVVLQFYAGRIMVFIGAAPSHFENIITNYALTQIPYIFGIGYLTILQRFCQAKEYNKLLAYLSIISFLVTIPIVFIFMFEFNFGYIGAGISKSAVICVLFIILLIYLIFCDSSIDSNIFQPLHWKVVLNYQGMKEYISLALPGLFQGGLDWFSFESIVIFSGFIKIKDDSDSTQIAITSNVIMYNLFLIVVSFGLAISNGISIRTGKYIGLGNIRYAQRAVKLGLVVTVILITFFGILFAVFNKDIPKLFSETEETIQVSSKLCFVMIIFTFCAFMQRAINGVFRALGKPKIAANATIVGYLVSFSLLFVVFFGLQWRKTSIFIGCTTMWICLSSSRIVAVIVQLVYWKFKLKWQSAHAESQRRIQQTIQQASTSKKKIKLPQLDGQDIADDNVNKRR